MLSKIIYALSFLVILCGGYLKAQNVMDKISNIEKAVFSITSYGSVDSEIVTSTGFFISPDGIGIAPASIFARGDSLSITLRNGREYAISRVLSTHKMANLAMFKTHDHREKGFDYIIPTQNTDRSLGEVLIFGHPEESEEGVTLGTIKKVYQAPYIDRFVSVNANFGPKSVGSPVINSEGKLVGIAGYLKKERETFFLSTYILNDSLWINHPYNSWKKSLYHQHQKTLAPDMNKGILFFMMENWVESAKNFTRVIKNDSTNIEAFIFRAEARRRYENFIGMRADYAYAKGKAPNHFLIHYFEAQKHMEERQLNNAFLSFISCIEAHQSFSPALIEFGLLVVDLRNDTETAMKCFNKAIISTPLYANAYYERSRLLQQYFEDEGTAMEDITRACNLDSFLPGVFSIRGTLKMRSENYLEAISDFDKAINIDPNDIHALFNRGIAYYNLGMKENSCLDWEAAGQRGHYKSIKYISRYCNNITSK
ncbi:serine protease [Labilibacter sediminis]|nr:serine protease [Labilibacter sediminis]